MMNDPESGAQAAAAAAPGTAVVLLFLSAAAFLSGVSLRVSDALLPRLAADFGVTVAVAAQVVTVFAVAYGVAQLLFGPLGDRYGKFRVIGWACSASALTALACSLAPGLLSLMWARALAGATTAAVIPLSMAWIGDHIPYEQRQSVLARFLLGQILGVSCGVLLGGVGADYLHWRTPFVLLALSFAAMAMGMFWQRKRMLRQGLVEGLPGVADAPIQGSKASHWGMLEAFGALLARPWARWVLLAVLLEGAFVYGVFAFVASHVHLAFDVSMTQAGAMVMCFGLGGLFYALASPWWIARLGEVGLTRWGGTLMALSLGAVALAPGVWWVAPACLMLGLGFYMMHNTLQVQATQMMPERRGAALSAFASCFFMGQASGVGLMGIWVSHWGVVSGLGLAAAGVVVLAWAFAHGLRQRQQI